MRAVRAMVRVVLEDMHGDFCQALFERWPSLVPPEQLLSALLLQVFYGIRSERPLMEQLDYNPLYRWFVGLDPEAAAWVPTTFHPRAASGFQPRDGSGGDGTDFHKQKRSNEAHVSVTDPESRLYKKKGQGQGDVANT